MALPNLVKKTFLSLVEHVTNTSKRPFLTQLTDPLILRRGPNFQFRDEIEQRQLKLRQLHAKLPLPGDSGPYMAFLQALYPHKLSLSRLEAHQSENPRVNHATLFKRYLELPAPGVKHIAPEDFEHFMKEIMSRRDFTKPTFVASDVSDYYRSRVYFRGYRSQLRQRWAHRKMCVKILRDLKEADIPVLTPEHDLLLYYTYFRDRKDIINEAIELGSEVAKKLNVSAQYFAKRLIQQRRLSRNWVAKIRESLPDPLPTSTLNVLLFCAFRNDKVGAVKDLRRCLKFSENSTGTTAPNSETFLTFILENAYGGTQKGSWRSAQNAFRHALILLTQFPHLVDIRTTNSIIHILVKSGAIKEADNVITAIVSNIDRPLDPEEEYLMRLTPADKEKYQTALHEVAENQAVTHKMYPTEKTFLPLLEHYCAQDTNQLNAIQLILHVMEHQCHLPLTTRIFMKVFEHMGRASVSLEDCKEMLARVIGLFDAYHDFSADLRINDKLERLNVPPEFGDLLQETISRDDTNISLRDGAFLKLLDHLVLTIYKTFILVVNKTNPACADKMKQERKDLFDRLRSRKPGSYSNTKEGPSTPELYKRDELNYIKKGYLIDLMDLATEEVEDHEVDAACK